MIRVVGSFDWMLDVFIDHRKKCLIEHSCFVLDVNVEWQPIEKFTDNQKFEYIEKIICLWI